MLALLALLFTHPALAIELRFLDSTYWPAAVEFRGKPLGGIVGMSALGDGNYLVVSSQEGADGAARVYVLSVGLRPDTQKLQVSVQREIALKDSAGLPYGKNALRPGSIAALPDGSWILTSQGDTRPDPRLPPAVIEFSADGKAITNLPLPEKFLPDSSGPQTKGTLGDQSLGALTLAPNLQDLFALTEGPLVQDGPPSTYDQGSIVRMVHWRRGRGNGGFDVADEYAYPLSSIPRLPHADNAQTLIGVSEAFALDDEAILVLERARVNYEGHQLSNSRLFETFRSTGGDISKQDTIRNQSIRPMSKKLVYDFDDVIPLLPEGHRAVGNLEAIAWGPLTAEGHRTLLFVSNSQFSPAQETQFLLFDVGH